MGLEDKRQLKRSLCYFDVHEETTGKIIGNAYDIHHEGFGLISKSEVPLFEELSICVKTQGTDASIQLVIKGIWNRVHEEPVHYNTGCRIINPPPETIHAINELVKSLTKRTGRPVKFSAPVASA